MIQTTNPSSEVIALAARQDYPAFYEREIKLRSSAKFPPFCDLVQIAVSSKNDVALSRAALALAAELKSLLAGDFSDVAAEVYGPFEAPIYKVQSEFRMRIVVKCVLNARSRAMFAALGDSFARSGREGRDLLGRFQSFGNLRIGIRGADNRRRSIRKPGNAKIRESAARRKLKRHGARSLPKSLQWRILQRRTASRARCRSADRRKTKPGADIIRKHSPPE